MWTPIAPRGYPPFYEHAGLGWTLGHYEGCENRLPRRRGFGWTDFLILLPEKRARSGHLVQRGIQRRATGCIGSGRLCYQRTASIVVSWMVPISLAFYWAVSRQPTTFLLSIKESGEKQYLFDEYELLPRWFTS